MFPRRGSLAGGTKLIIEGKGNKELLTTTHIRPCSANDLSFTNSLELLLKLRPGICENET